MKIDFDNHPHVTVTNQYYYVEIRYSLSKLAAKLGAVWCVYERSWRIQKTHPNAAQLVSLAGYRLLIEHA